ncbi:unnamed protein product [Nezara viridula]|uniref:Uncharacterized protein n=1 Tax=Nezara viridula TaxID=85310 RepID=A0A9P0H9G8_NEZVI|nr:unnamed protein product [Nezara viridula]
MTGDQDPDHDGLHGAEGEEDGEEAEVVGGRVVTLRRAQVVDEYREDHGMVPDRYKTSRGLVQDVDRCGPLPCRSSTAARWSPSRLCNLT